VVLGGNVGPRGCVLKGDPDLIRGWEVAQFGGRDWPLDCRRLLFPKLLGLKRGLGQRSLGSYEGPIAMALKQRTEKPSKFWPIGRVSPWWAAGVAGAGVIYFFGLGPVLTLVNALPHLESLDHTVRADLADKRYSQLMAQLPTTTKMVVGAHAALDRLSYLAWIPAVGSSFGDMKHLADAGYDIVLAANDVAPELRPILNRRESHTKTAGLENVLAHLPSLWTGLSRALPNVRAADRALAAVNFATLPKRLDAMSSVERYRPEIAIGTSILGAMVKNRGLVSQMLGIPHPARYLLILENSGELRAGGGFITAYGYLNLKDGVLEHAHVQAISVLQRKIQYHPPTPWPINNFWPKLTYWGVRDAAILPNMPTNARVIERFYDSVPHHLPIDGVVFVDSWLADSLIEKTGTLHLGTSYGNQRITAAHANEAMEYVAERLGTTQAQSKAFLGTLLNELRVRFLHASGSKLVGLLSTLEAGVAESHMAVYFNNPAQERLAVRWGASGQVPRTVDGDYLSVVNDNLGAHKDNFFLQTSITTTLQPLANGRIEETTKIHWTMPAVAHGWLVVPYTGWNDVYVPKGSHLISATVMPGSKIRVGVNQSMNKTVFGMRLDIPARTSLSVPPTTANETIVYTLPKGTNPRKILIQKQPGVFGQTVTVNDGTLHTTYYQTRTLHLTLP